ncbi:MAG TPA: NAD(P)-dependent oxidoreductase [Bryobacteraceae bacterium]|jgi:glutamate synthase (NADPH/NADH) small chain|nr:NAD(P)-dependent oxidoreductase [Bryobacteraceae bacterium]
MTNEQEFAASFAEIHPPLGPHEALVETHRCLYCFDAPCASACPTHIDVPGFIKKIASGNLAGSAITILNANILGLSCARVCPVDVLCEGACVLHRYNQRPIEIGRLQRHAMDHFYGNGMRLPMAATAKSRRVACIGAGPASLACAAALRQQGYAVTIFDRRPLAGGLNTYGVAEYKLRPADSLQEVALVRSLGVEFQLNAEIGGGLRVKELEEAFDIIFLGVGLGRTQPLGIPGEGLPGVIDALRFIAEYKTQRGARVGRRVVVIGGGNTAIDAATAALRLGAEEVHILYRRSEAEMPAFTFEFDLAKREGARFHWLTQPVAIHGSTAVEAVECIRMELGPPDRRGRHEPRQVPGSNFRLACDMVIPSIGQSRLLDFLSQFRDVQLLGGCVAVDPATGQTSNPLYFAGGDCVNGGREVVDAVAEGKRAAVGIARLLEAAHG